MPRITGGSLRGRRVKAPAGHGTRPSADRVKEALFNILGQDLSGLMVLDVFAGSGALGLEALSRGAAGCLLVENAPAAQKAISENLAALGLGQRGRLFRADATGVGVRGQGPFDLVLADPPYEKGLVQGSVELAARVLKPGGRLVIEHSPKERPADGGGLRRYDRRRYGQTELSFFIQD